MNPGWKTIRFDSPGPTLFDAVGHRDWDRNWCWIGVKARKERLLKCLGIEEICHQHLKTPRSWTHYREEAFRQGLAPDPRHSAFHGLQNPEAPLRL